MFSAVSYIHPFVSHEFLKYYLVPWFYEGQRWFSMWLLSLLCRNSWETAMLIFLISLVSFWCYQCYCPLERIEMPLLFLDCHWSSCVEQMEHHHVHDWQEQVPTWSPIFNFSLTEFILPNGNISLEYCSSLFRFTLIFFCFISLYCLIWMDALWLMIRFWIITTLWNYLYRDFVMECLLIPKKCVNFDDVYEHSRGLIFWVIIFLLGHIVRPLI